MPGPISDSYPGPPSSKRARNVTTCVFCGHEYPAGTPRSQAKLLYDHVAICEKHPAAGFRKRAEAAEAVVARLEAFIALGAEQGRTNANWYELCDVLSGETTDPRPLAITPCGCGDPHSHATDGA